MRRMRSYLEGVSLSDRLRVGIIGVGGIATGAHIPGYQAVEDKVEFVACADVNADRAREVAEKFGFSASYGDYKEMLAKEKLDVVSVCTPNKFHAPATIAALEAGCHVLCEKPPALTTAEAVEMVKTAEKHGKILTFGLMTRYSSEVQACKRLIEGGELGKVYFARVDALRRRGIPGWGVFTNKELQGGGPVIDIGVHMLDTALYLMGYPKPTQVLASAYQEIGTRPGVGTMGSWDWQNFQIEDLAVAMIKFENGASILLETSFAQNIEELGKMNVRLSGTEGGANLFPLKVFKEAYGALYDWTPAWMPKVDKRHTEEVKHFVRACLGEVEPGDDPMVTGSQAIRLQQVLDAIYQSAEKDDIVYINE